MIIVETSVWVDVFCGTVNDYTEWMNRNLTDPRLSLTDLTLCEVLQGLTSDATHAIACEELLKFRVHATGGAELALSLIHI